MSGYHDRLQGTDRLLRIRRIRKAVFAGLFALGILLIFVRLEGEGASLKPFFLPVNGIIEVALIMGLTASIIGLFLRNLEIHHALRDNQRFLMAKSSMTRALRTAAFAIGLAIALLLAITPSLATTLFSDPLQVVSLRPNGSEVVTFTSPDALGLTFVTYATVGVTNGAASVDVGRVRELVPRVLELAKRFDVGDVRPAEGHHPDVVLNGPGPRVPVWGHADRVVARPPTDPRPDEGDEPSFRGGDRFRRTGVRSFGPHCGCGADGPARADEIELRRAPPADPVDAPTASGARTGDPSIDASNPSANASAAAAHTSSARPGTRDRRNVGPESGRARRDWQLRGRPRRIRGSVAARWRLRPGPSRQGAVPGEAEATRGGAGDVSADPRKGPEERRLTPR